VLGGERVGDCESVIVARKRMMEASHIGARAMITANHSKKKSYTSAPHIDFGTNRKHPYRAWEFCRRMDAT
jgi:hypothetical protein